MALDFLHHIRAESAAFRAAIERADPTEPVPTCPGWNADDLLWHLAEVQYFWSQIVAGPLTDPSLAVEPERPEGRAALLDFFDSSNSAMVQALETTDPATPAYTWATEKTVGFTFRRQAHEALVHRLDAELTAGEITAIDPALAADGVLEVLQPYWGELPDWSENVEGSSVVGVIDLTDTGDRWWVDTYRWNGTNPDTGTVYQNDTTVSVVDQPAGEQEPAFRIAGSAADVNRWIWSRHPEGPVDRTGTTDIIDELVADGMQ